MPLVWANPDNTMSITPSAVAGTVILSADENARNNEIQTKYNSHGHTSLTGNSWTLGDGSAGNKSFCADATNDSCIRWEDTARLWTVQQPASSYNELAVISGTAGLKPNAVVVGDGTGALRTVSGVGISGQALISQSDALPVWQTLGSGSAASADRSKVVTFARTAAAGSGNQSITGLGFQPTTLFAHCDQTGAGAPVSLGYGDEAKGNEVERYNGANWDQNNSRLIMVSDGTNDMNGVIASLDSDGFTITWTKVAAGINTDCQAMGVR